jgi:hypothetical protein
MTSPHVNAVVRLRGNLPTLGLRGGDEGIVVSVWISPGEFQFEVEFPQPGGSPGVRARLCVEQLEVVKSQPTGI